MLQLTHMCITIYVYVNFFVAPFNCLAGIILLFFVVIVFFFCLSLLKLDLFYPYRLPIYIHMYVYTSFLHSLLLILTSKCERVVVKRSKNLHWKSFRFQHLRHCHTVGCYCRYFCCCYCWHKPRY